MKWTTCVLQYKEGYITGNTICCLLQMFLLSDITMIEECDISHLHVMPLVFS